MFYGNLPASHTCSHTILLLVIKLMDFRDAELVPILSAINFFYLKCSPCGSAHCHFLFAIQTQVSVLSIGISWPPVQKLNPSKLFFCMSHVLLCVDYITLWKYQIFFLYNCFLVYCHSTHTRLWGPVGSWLFFLYCIFSTNNSTWQIMGTK